MSRVDLSQGLLQIGLASLKDWRNFSGRATRKEYCAFTIIMLLIDFVALSMLAMIATAAEPVLLAFGLLYLTVQLMLLVPQLAVTIRRLHDVGLSGWYLFVLLIALTFGQIVTPEAGGLIMLIALIFLMCSPSTEDNKWGRNIVKNMPATKPFDPEADPIDQIQVADAYSSIEQLGELKNKGLISEEEFEAKKAKLLDKIQ